jgi:parallel beta-helix repeat protein
LIGIAAALVFLPIPSSSRGEFQTGTANIAASDHVFSSNTPVTPFNITRNSDFLIYSQYGAGTAASPYVIQNLNISSPGVCVLIANTTSHFIIRNCILASENTEYGYGSLTLMNLANGRVEGSFFEGGYYGIAAHQCRTTEFADNTFDVRRMVLLSTQSSDCAFSGNSQAEADLIYPIHIQDGERLSIRSNTFGAAISEGIRLATSSHCVIENNTVEMSSSSTYSLSAYTLRDCTYCDVLENSAVGFAVGVDVRGGGHNRAIHNTVTACIRGIRITSNSTEVLENQVSTYFDGVDLMYSYGAHVARNEIRSGSTDSFGISVIGGSDIMVESNGITMSAVGIRLQGTRESQFVSNVIDNCTSGIIFEEDSGPPVSCSILNNTLIGCGFAFDLWNPMGFDQRIEGNTVNGQEMGYFFNRTDEVIEADRFGQLTLAACDNVFVKQATYRGQSTAVSILFCSDVEVSGMSLIGNEVGIHIRSSSQTTLNSVYSASNSIGLYVESSLNSYIYRSHFTRNDYGVLIEDSRDVIIYGCEIDANYLSAIVIGADGSTIEGNYIHHNEYGLHLLRTDYCTVIGNKVHHNAYTGILVNRGCEGNRIYGNSFGWNGVNAVCGGPSNQWDDGVSRGNQWSDFEGEGVYVIDADDADRYPEILAEDTTTSETVTEQTYNVLNDPFVTLAVALAACAAALNLFNLRQSKP